MTLPSELLRESPTSSGRPIAASSSSRRTSSRLWATVLPKPIPGSRQTSSSGDARRDREGEPLLEKTLHVRHHVVIRGVDLHRARLALHVHEAEIAARVGDDACELGIASQSGDVVDELDAELERAPGDRRLGGVDRDRRARQVEQHLLDPLRAPRSAVTPTEPGRVDSPPTSTIAAPQSSMPHAAVTAASTRRWTPPSENESGVTLITPITDGAGNRSAIGMRAFDTTE